MITQKRPEEEVVKSSFRNKILSFSKCEHDTRTLEIMLGFLPHIVATLAPLDHYAGPIERREAFLSFLFYFDPRFVRIQGILDLCSIKSIHGNRGNIINYLVKSPHKLNYSEAITIFESYLADGYTSKGIYFTKLEGKTAIVVDDLTQKTNLTKFINKYCGFKFNKIEL